ncbi:MAG: MacS family sensor histidine kinase [Mycobacteriaceae bacterium]
MTSALAHVRAERPHTEPHARLDPATPLWRGATVFRVLTYIFAVGVQVAFNPHYANRTLSWVVIVAMGVWTLVSGLGHIRGWGRNWPMTAADVVVVLVLMASSRLILTPTELASPDPLVTTIWAANPVVAAAVLAGPALGFFVGLVVAVATALVNKYADTDISRDGVLLMCTGLVLGVAASTARRSHAELERALRVQVATAERDRLARAVHDSVLQVLAYVRRQGMELGGEAAALATMAGEQEVALRALVSAAPTDPNDENGWTSVDLRPLLQAQASPGVSVSVPATAVPLPGPDAAELAAVARTALSNVAVHAGPDAKAYVLLEDLGSEVVLSVRDDGCGIAEGRLQQAESEGRMGVAQSIRARVADLGGHVALETAPHAGTEWEVHVPRRATPAPRTRTQRGRKGRPRQSGAPSA